MTAERTTQDGVFSDDDLRKFKACIPSVENTWQEHVASTPLNLQALLARLAHVEQYAERIHKMHPGLFTPEYQAWLRYCGKSAGK